MRQFRPLILFLGCIASGCSLWDDGGGKKNLSTGLIATPPSYYSTAKARYLGTTYKENLDRLAERITRNSTTSQLQFANNISSVGGIGFFTHSATKTPDERFLEVVLATPETFETKGEYSEKVNRLFARYGQELLGILAGDTQIYQDKELSGYGLNFTWRTMVGDRATMARAIIYFPKEKVSSFLRRDLAQNDLLGDAVIFAVEENGPLNLVSYQPRDNKPDFRPAIREDNLAAGTAEAKPLTPPSSSAAAKPANNQAKLDAIKNDAGGSQDAKVKPASTKPTRTEKVEAKAPTSAPKISPPLAGSADQSSSGDGESAVESIALAKPTGNAAPMSVGAEVKTEPRAASIPAGESSTRLPVETSAAPVTAALAVPNRQEATTSTAAPASAERKVMAKPSAEAVTMPAESVKQESIAAPTPRTAKLPVSAPAGEDAAMGAPSLAKLDSRAEAVEPLGVPLASAPKSFATPAASAAAAKELAGAGAQVTRPTAPEVDAPPAAKPLELPVNADAEPRAGLKELAITPAAAILPAAGKSVEVKKADDSASDAAGRNIETAVEANGSQASAVRTGAPKTIVAAQNETPTPDITVPQAAPALRRLEVLPEPAPARKIEVPAPMVVKAEPAPAPKPVPTPAIVTTVPEKAGDATPPEQLALLRKPLETPIEKKPLARSGPRSLEGFIIQIAFNNKEKAQTWADKMQQRGYAVSVTEAGVEGALRVRLGNFPVRDEAERQLRNFKLEGLNGIIINLPQAFRPEVHSSVP
jgi:hypothetical protein